MKQTQKPAPPNQPRKSPTLPKHPQHLSQTSPELVAGVWAGFQSRLQTQIDGASLGAFRIAVGLVMALEAWSLCRPSASSNGKIPLEVFYTGPDVKFHFPYPGFHWLPW